VLVKDQKQPKNAPVSVTQLMSGSDTSFGKILQRAKALNQLNQRVSGLLDKDLAKHCQVANVRDGKMIFTCTSPGYATRLKLQTGQLLDELETAGLEGINKIEVKVSIEPRGRGF